MANNRGPASHSSRKPPRKADGEFKKLFIFERKKRSSREKEQQEHAKSIKEIFWESAEL